MNALLERIYAGNQITKKSKARRATGTSVPDNRILQMLSASERRDFGFGPLDAPARDHHSFDGLAYRR